MNQATEPRLLPSRDVRNRFGVTNMTLWRWQQQGTLPEPVKINGRNYWPEDVINKLMQAGA